MEKFIVYKATNTINGKIYFGITKCTLFKRINEHKCKAKNPKTFFHFAIKKHGFENFFFEIVASCNDERTMYLSEIELISMHNSNNRLIGYNNSTGGEKSTKGSKRTEEAKQKISTYQKSRKRNPMTQETKIKIGLANKGNVLTDEQKFILSNIKKGKSALNKIMVSLNDVEFFDSMSAAAKEKSIAISTISNNIKGKSKNSKLGIWKLVHQI